VELSSHQSAFSVEGLMFRYRHAGTQVRDTSRPDAAWALKHLTFEVKAGEIMGVIGPNGSGKTSLLKVLGKVLRPEGGTVRLFGENMELLRQGAVARTVALVPQESHQIFPFTIAETVLMGRFPHHRCRGFGSLVGFSWEDPDDLHLAQQAMDDMDVAHLASRSIFDVSGGERQRVMIARALAQEPRILLLDEPTAFLDLHHQLDICRILRRLNEDRGLTVVLVSHDLNLASQYCDRLMLLDHGVVYRIGLSGEVIRPEALKAVYQCEVLIDAHPVSGLPRVTLPGRNA
ncbi:MAG TPA: ABC transporter ATP-binding protein, partial [Nitrospiraceae bacterium]|nr:ABC transporter ATP-binding protein [Nitrospiraceae bacterium]